MHSLDDFEVGNVKVLVLRCVVVLFRDEDALCNITIQDGRFHPKLDVPSLETGGNGSSRAPTYP